MTAKAHHLIAYGMLETQHHADGYYHRGNAYRYAEHGNTHRRATHFLRAVTTMIKVSCYVEWKGHYSSVF